MKNCAAVTATFAPLLIECEKRNSATFIFTVGDKTETKERGCWIVNDEMNDASKQKEKSRSLEKRGRT